MRGIPGLLESTLSPANAIGAPYLIIEFDDERRATFRKPHPQFLLLWPCSLLLLKLPPAFDLRMVGRYANGRGSLLSGAARCFSNDTSTFACTASAQTHTKKSATGPYENNIFNAKTAPGISRCVWLGVCDAAGFVDFPLAVLPCLTPFRTETL